MRNNAWIDLAGAQREGDFVIGVGGGAHAAQLQHRRADGGVGAAVKLADLAPDHQAHQPFAGDARHFMTALHQVPVAQHGQAVAKFEDFVQAV